MSGCNVRRAAWVALTKNRYSWVPAAFHGALPITVGRNANMALQTGRPMRLSELH